MTASGPDTTLVRAREGARDLDEVRDAWAQRARLYDLLRRFRAGVLVTRARDGGTSARPMLVASIDETSDELGFLATADAPCVEELDADPRTMAIFQDARHHLTWSGRARIVRERYRILRAWRRELEQWLPSADEADLVLIVVCPELARFWSGRPAVASAAARALDWTSHGPRRVLGATRYGEVRFELDPGAGDW